MSQRSGFPPLGEILRSADLISSAQLEVALQDQNYYQIRLGEIIALHGWLDQATADFFAESWYKLTMSEVSHPLGYYLQQAALLSEEQIREVLEEQKQMGVRFGAVAVLKGWLKQRTIDYFIENLAPSAKGVSAFQSKKNELSHLLNEEEELPENESSLSELGSQSLYMSESIIILPDNYYAESQQSASNQKNNQRSSKPIIQIPRKSTLKNKAIKNKINPALAYQKSADGEDFDLEMALDVDLEEFGLSASTEGSITW